MPDGFMTQVSALSVGGFLLCSLVSIATGLIIAIVYMYKSAYNRSFVITLATLPLIVQIVISLVNGNLGAGVAVVGAFNLVRFRSAQGSAREIGAIFLAMAAGLALGMGYIFIALGIALLVGAVIIVLNSSGFARGDDLDKDLKITIPESLDYNGVFDDVFKSYLDQHELKSVRTTNMGSLYKLEYKVRVKRAGQEKQFMDELRCRNGNLEIAMGKLPTGHEEL